jgi:hypothetical protein
LPVQHFQIAFLKRFEYDPVEHVAMSITLMVTMKNYFDYTLRTWYVFTNQYTANCVHVHCSCGIPKYTLLGSVEDYESIIDRCKEIRKLIPDLQVIEGRGVQFGKKLFLLVFAVVLETSGKAHGEDCRIEARPSRR